MSSEFSELRRSVTNIVKHIRMPRLENSSPDRPVYVQNYDIILDGQIYKRKKIILVAPGCSSPTCTMCPIPNESVGYGGVKIGHLNFVRQFEYAFSGEDPNSFELIALYNSGNWFADREIPPETRVWFYDFIGQSKCAGISVESLPQFVTERRIQEAKDHLKGKKLVVGIGLQSVDDFIRSVCVNTTCTKSQFEKATILLRDSDYIPRVYIMVKPPFLTELEAINETVNSIKYVESRGYKDASICPTRIAPFTVVNELAKRDLYNPPSLWSVIEILKRVDSLGIQTRVSCLDVDGKDEDTIYPRNCKKCTPRILAELTKYNLGELTIKDLVKLNCNCRYEYQMLLEKEKDTIGRTPIINRVRQFLELYCTDFDSRGINSSS